MDFDVFQERAKMIAYEMKDKKLDMVKNEIFVSVYEEGNKKFYSVRLNALDNRKNGLDFITLLFLLNELYSHPHHTTPAGLHISYGPTEIFWPLKHSFEQIFKNFKNKCDKAKSEEAKQAIMMKCADWNMRYSGTLH